MAHLAILVDDDASARDAFAAAVGRQFADLPNATLFEERSGPLVAIWACGPHTPVSVHREGGVFALLIGHAIDDGGHHLTAGQLAQRWLAPAAEPQLFDGYHVGVVHDPAAGLVAGVDPFGMFPLVFGPVGQSGFIVSTTPAVFSAHPAFRPRIDRLGLAGILLAHGPLDNRPLLAGIRRLATGHQVRWRFGQVTEVEAHRLVGTPPPPRETPDETRRRIDHELVTAIRRHRPPTGETSLLLSGGLDSRLVAGILAAEGMPSRALVLGRPDDFEVVAGSAVARALGMPIEVVSTESLDAGFPDRVRKAVRFSHLHSAPGADDFAEGLGSARSTAACFWSGIGFDWVFEPVSHANGRDPQTGRWEFLPLVARMNLWGVPAARLPALLGADGADLVATAIGRLEAACLGGPSPPELQSSLLRWDQRVRNHIATTVHRTSFFSWPLIPGTDRRFFAALFGLPVEAYADRVLEEQILRVRSPALCAIPLDTNSFRFEPLGGRRGWAARAAAPLRSLDRGLRRWWWRHVRRRDPRRYERLFNVDHPRWIAVRRAAEPARHRLHALLDAGELAAMLPPPDRPTGCRNPVIDGGGLRLLLGLALLLDDAPRLAD